MISITQFEGHSQFDGHSQIKDLVFKFSIQAENE